MPIRQQQHRAQQPKRWSILVLRLLLRQVLLMAAGLFGAPISAVQVLVCENGADYTTAVVASIGHGELGRPNVSRELAAALGWEPGAGEPQVHRRDGRTLLAPFDATQLQDGELLYLVRPDRHWMWPTGDVQQRIELDSDDFTDRHYDGEGLERQRTMQEPWAAGLPPPVLTRLANSPRLFSVENFISEDEVDALVQTTEDGASAFALKRSVTGANGAEESTTRTSENSFDTDSDVAMRLKRRAFRLLRMDYAEVLADGLQVLRYQHMQAYIPHHDYFSVSAEAARSPTNTRGHWGCRLKLWRYLPAFLKRWVCSTNGATDSNSKNSTTKRTGTEDGHGTEHNPFDFQWDPQYQPRGSNRFATLLLYLSDVDEGGATVFPELPPLHVANKYTEASTRDRGDDIIDANGWEADMVEQCRTRFAVAPRRGQAILFYSQMPDGALDPNSLHGGCPVLKGIKWAANLWVWNRPRWVPPAPGSTSTDGGGAVVSNPLGVAGGEALAGVDRSTPIKVEFKNTKGNGVGALELLWGDQHWALIDSGASVTVTSYHGHRWIFQLPSDESQFTQDEDDGGLSPELNVGEIILNLEQGTVQTHEIGDTKLGLKQQDDERTGRNAREL